VQKQKTAFTAVFSLPAALLQLIPLNAAAPSDEPAEEERGECKAGCTSSDEGTGDVDGAR
jgi:hypothetical protein